MTATVTTSTLIGSDSLPVYIEADMSNSLPGTVIVGLGDKAISEAKERIRSAIKNSKLENPKKRITINLSPADIPKDGSHFDLGMALSILQLSGQLPPDCLKETLVIGELGLDGSVRQVNGVIGHILCAQKQGIKRVILPLSNVREAQLVDNMKYVAVDNLRELTDQLVRGKVETHEADHDYQPPSIKSVLDISDVAGQQAAKRALEIAAAGGHNILLSGPPGGGKTMLAQMLPTIMPVLTKQQIIEATHIHSIGSSSTPTVITAPPFRSPHHSASHVSLVGGGTKPRPGEVSLAHNGVLFMDEIPEFSRQALEALRQPLEDGEITVSRVNSSVTFPAKSLLVATQNPCPCGHFGNPKQVCDCPQARIDAYQSKLSGPLLDRIDMFVHVEPTEHNKLLASTPDGESSKSVQRRVQQARDAQLSRFGKPASQLSSKEIKGHSLLGSDLKLFLDEAADKLSLSSRAYMKVIKVARSIADLAELSQIEKAHLAEALQLRQT